MKLLLTGLIALSIIGYGFGTGIGIGIELGIVNMVLSGGHRETRPRQRVVVHHLVTQATTSDRPAGVLVPTRLPLAPL